jgi:hypothetical protein
MIWAFIMLRMYKAAAVLSVLMEMYTIHCHDRGHITVMLVLQSCTDSLQVMTDSSTETFRTSSDGTCDVANVEVEEHIDIKEEEEEEVNVKTEKVFGSEEEECIDIKDEAIYSEEEKEEEVIDTQEEENVEIKEEVS